jgi:hypothetical protein
VGFELTKLLCEGIKLGILSNNDMRELEEFINNVKHTERENSLGEIKGRSIPIFIKKNKDYFVL